MNTLKENQSLVRLIIRVARYEMMKYHTAALKVVYFDLNYCMYKVRMDLFT